MWSVSQMRIKIANDATYFLEVNHSPLTNLGIMQRAHSNKHSQTINVPTHAQLEQARSESSPKLHWCVES